MVSPIFITAPGLVSFAVLRAWMASGREIREIWARESGPKGGALLRFSALGVPIRILRPPFEQLPAVSEGADALFTVLTFQIVPEELLERFGSRALNLHPALLPAMRGPAPRQAMLWENSADRYGGLTVHVLEREIDRGPIVAQRAVPPGDGESWMSWEERLAGAAAELFTDDVPKYLSGDTRSRSQADGSGFYRTARADEFVVTQEKSAAAVRRLLESQRGAPTVCRPEGGFRGGPPIVFVTRFQSILGPPQSRLPLCGRRYVELDVADARVRLERPGLMHNWEELAALARTRRAALEIGRSNAI